VKYYSDVVLRKAAYTSQSQGFLYILLKSTIFIAL